jgi:hypothetical protein
VRTAAAVPQRQPVELPKGFWYSVKCRALSLPLVTEQLKNQRLSRPLALGVLSRLPIRRVARRHDRYRRHP